MVFDRHNAAIAEIHKRAVRADPYLSVGTIAIRYTIAPDGSVSNCEVAKSSFNDPAFEQQIVRHVMTMDFGARDTPPLTVKHYELRFHNPNPDSPDDVFPPETLQIWLNRQLPAFTSLHAKARARWPEVARIGLILVRIQIAPDGGTRESTLVSSTFGHPEFEAQVLELLHALRYDGKNVPVSLTPSPYQELRLRLPE